jgi:hypothetical protein
MIFFISTETHNTIVIVISIDPNNGSYGILPGKELIAIQYITTA